MRKNQIIKLLFVISITLSTVSSSFAGGPDIYQGKGRIALSSDGNMHDNDDMLATKMSLMILAKAGLQDKTVLYTYADHVWGSENNDLEIMRESAEVTGEKFGFNKCRFMAAVEDPEAAYNAMCEEIIKSTAKNPLYIIAAGPMQVVGEALNRANKKKPKSLNHVTVLSHSVWNNEHADKPELGKPHGSEEPHSGWTWKEMIAEFGDKVNFNQISDQNGTGEGAQAYKTKDKFAAPTWESWAWMKNHKDPNIRWVADNSKIKCRPDYSDAGMFYYFCADLDGVRGDEFGNPEKLRRWVGEDVIPIK